MIDKADINKFKQQILADFNSRTNYDNSTFHLRLANRLIELAQLHSGQLVLDIATGTGMAAIAAARIVGREGHVVGVDISPGMLEQAKRKIEASGLKNIEFIEADADYLNFSDRSFDAVLCSSAIAYLTDIPAVLRQWYRFLKPGGLVAFSCFAETAFPTSVLFRAVAQRYGISIPNPNEPLGTPQRCHKLLREAGFKDIDVKTEQFGWYSSIANATVGSWDGNSKSAFGFQVFELSPEKLEQCKAEFFKEVEALATDGEIWHDATAFFVLARK